MRRILKPWYIRENPVMNELTTRDVVQRRFTDTLKEKRKYAEAVKKIRMNKSKKEEV